MDIGDVFSQCRACGHLDNFSTDFEVVALGDPKPYIIRPRAYSVHTFKTIEAMHHFESIVNGNPISYIPEGGDKNHFFMTRCKKCGAIDRMEINKDKSTCHACQHEDYFAEIGMPDYDLYEFKTENDMIDFKTHCEGGLLL